MPPTVPAEAPDFVKEVTAKMIEGKGEEIKVSADARRRHLAHRHHPVRKTQHRGPASRNGMPTHCIQCGQCSLVCPHAAIRMKIVKPPT